MREVGVQKEIAQNLRHSLTLGSSSLLRSKTESRRHVRVVQLLLHLHPCKYVSTVAVLTLWNKQQLWASHFYAAPDFPPCNEAERTSPSAALSLQSSLSKWTNHSAALRVGGACVRIWIPVCSGWLIFSGEWWLSKKNWVSRHWDRFYDAASYARRKISRCFFSFSWSLISWILHSAPWINLQRLFSLHYLVC